MCMYMCICICEYVYASAGEGVVQGPGPVAGWIEVKWDNDRRACYRWGADGKHDLAIVEGTTKAGKSEVTCMHASPYQI